jgi:threonine dehydrogenase-like Zn-dependent dehydrogenase
VGIDGTIVLTGQSVGTKIPIEIGKLIWRHAQIVGSCGAPYFFPETIDFIAKKLIDFEKLITHRFPIDKALEAFELGNSGKAGKIMIYPDPQKMPKK